MAAASPFEQSQHGAILAEHFRRPLPDPLPRMPAAQAPADATPGAAMLKMIRDDAGELPALSGCRRRRTDWAAGKRRPLLVGQQQSYLGFSGVVEKEGELLGRRRLLAPA